MPHVQEENLELHRSVHLLAHRLLGEIETGRNLDAVKRIAFLGGPVAAVARNGGGYQEAFAAVESKLEQLDFLLNLKLARAGFGPAEREALLPQFRSRVLGAPASPAVGPPGTQQLPPGGEHYENR